MESGVPESFIDCFDEEGELIQEKFTEFFDSAPKGSFIRRYCELIPDEVAGETPKLKKKRAYYEREDPKTSTWFKYYIGRPVTSKKALRKFRRRFRLPYAAFIRLVRDARENKWFPKTERCDAIGRPGAPLELLILGALRYLGRGWTFDDIEESTGVSEEVHRTFFYDFIRVSHHHYYIIQF